MRNRGTARTSGGNEPDNDDLIRLQKRLKAAYRQAGEPPYRELVALTRLSKSTLSRIFNAKKPPKYLNLQRVLMALGVPTADHPATWYPLWYQAVNRVKPLDDPVSTPPGELDPQGPAKGCPVCGAAVVDAQVHAKWHTELRRSARVLDGVERRTRHLAQIAIRTTPQPADRTRRTDGTPGTQPPATGDGLPTGKRGTP